MDIVELSIKRPVYAWMLIIISIAGGLWGLSSIGRLEDPEFTIKVAKIYTAYPGASAEQVELEVTEKLEVAIQQMAQVSLITSTSKPELSEITVEIGDQYKSNRLPQIWDELRKKIRDEARNFPPSVAQPLVYDDFGQVYGLYYAVTGDDFSYSELREITKEIRRELLTVTGVSRIRVSGIIEEVAYLDISEQRLAQLGYSLDDLKAVVDAEKAVPPLAKAQSGIYRPNIMVESDISDIEAINNILVGQPGSTAMLKMSDIVDASLGYKKNPALIAQHNGKRALTLGIAAAPNTNIVDVGTAVTQRLDLIRTKVPAGVDISPIYLQSHAVAKSVDGFLINLISSMVIVTLVLCLFMGWRAGVVVGAILGLAVLATIMLMNFFGLNLQRISLGALVIAMGMLVDNAIVIAEGILIGLQRGSSLIAASRAIVKQTKTPLLGSTIIGIMAFSGIGLSQDSVGEFLFSLFAVIGISLLLSWVFAIVLTPYLAHLLFKADNKGDDELYHGILYHGYRQLLTLALRFKGLTLILLTMITISSYLSFGLIKQGFFPNSNTPMFFINYWIPQGASIQETLRLMQAGEKYLLNQDEVTSVSLFAGGGADRFMLTYNPEDSNPAYGQLIVQVNKREDIDAVEKRFFGTMPAQQPNADITAERLVFGPAGGADVETRISGYDPKLLRTLAEHVKQLYREAGLQDVKHDWREQETNIIAKINTEASRVAGLSNSDVAKTLQFAAEGYPIGQYQRNDRNINIVVRIDEAQRNLIHQLGDRLVWNPLQRSYIPLSQVVDEFAVRPIESLIKRRDRLRTITIKGNSVPGETAMASFAKVRDAVEALALPEGYRMAWGGEYENAGDAQRSLGRGLPLGLLVMILTTFLLFGTVKEPVMIWAVVPMALCGVVIGLLATDLPFGFMSLLGVLSLSGMLIKNAVVLVEEINLQIQSGKAGFQAIIDASVSRLRPVLLAAITTILGMLPLLTDAFFADMAVTIMGGLGFATILTLIAIPSLYAILHRISRE